MIPGMDPDPSSPRTAIASDRPPERDPRVFLAIERTFLAWTRTALALMGFGFVVARVGLLLAELAGASLAVDAVSPAASSRGLWFGLGFVILGVIVQTIALVERHQQVRRFRSGEDIVPIAWSLSAVVGAILIVIGLAMTVYLFGLMT
jgi:putative membrane protein